MTETPNEDEEMREFARALFADKGPKRPNPTNKENNS